MLGNAIHETDQISFLSDQNNMLSDREHLLLSTINDESSNASV